MAHFHNNALIGASGGQGGGAYEIERSLRFNINDSANLSRTFSSSGNRRTWTLSWWMKLGKLSGNRGLFGMPGTSSGTPQFYSRIGSDHKLYVYEYNTSGTYQFIKKTDAVLRDPSAWYHCVFQFDSTQSTAEDGFKIYINGTRVTSWSTNTLTNYSQNYEGAWNSNANTGVHVIGRSDSYFDGYMAEIHFVDGTALAPTDFGEYDDNNNWSPKKFSGTYGSNGFHLDFSDNSSTAALGTDSSGNSNTWTVNNLTAQGPSTATQFKVYGNASTSGSSSTTNVSSLTTLQGTNVSTYNIGGTNYNHLTADLGSVGTHAIQARTYLNIGTDILVFVSNNGSSWSQISNQQDPYVFSGRYIQWVRTSQGYDNQVLTAKAAASATDSLIDTPTNYEADSGNNGGNYATMNPTDNANGLTLSNGNLDAENTAGSNKGSRLNFKFPSSGKWYIEATALTLGGNLCLGVSPGDQSATVTVAGTDYILINSSGSTVERYSGGSAVTYSSAFNSYSTGAILQIAYDADSQKLWFGLNNQWMDSGTTVTGNPSSGSNPTLTSMSDIFPSVSLYTSKLAINAGQRSFSYTPPTNFKSLCTQNFADPAIAEGASVFDITLYTGNGSGQTISGLDFSPDWAWIKRRSGSTDHCINDTVRGAGKQLNINQNYAEVTNTNNFAAFTSDGFTVGNGSQTNAANPPETHVAWTWDAGESNTSITAGSLNSTAYNTDRVWSNGIANSNSDFDQAKTNAFNGNRSNMLRTGGNQVLVTLNFSPALTVSNSIEILGEGWPTAAATFVFTVDGSTTTRTTSQGRPATFNVSGSLTRITMNNVSSNGRTYLTYIKVDGKELIDSNITPPNIPSIASTVRTNQSAGFSIVSYEGNNTGGATIGHGLNAQPKFIVVKDRDSTSGWWAVYHDGVGAGKGGYLNDGQAFSAQSHWSYSDPSSSVFYVGANANTNANQNDFIAYCFAPVEGYSAFGSYTGNGSADGPFIYTGFRPRWLMIKSSSNSGEDWLLLDTSRDPSNTANSTAMYASQRHADNSTNAITTNILSNGFKCIGTNAATNASGYTYIYHAFAEHPFKTARAR